MFLGTHEPKLDEKGRLILPARFRDELSEGLVITKGQEHCLYVWSKYLADREKTFADVSEEVLPGLF
ncbi:MAG: hypothetical protein EBW09_00995 [Actinobacteria bacterium]|nr:hypothetical protein [Actinomycetota bacterium]